MTERKNRRPRLRRIVKAFPKIYRFLRTPRGSLPPLEKGQVRRFRAPRPPRPASVPEDRCRRPDAVTKPTPPKAEKAPRPPKPPKRPKPR